MDIRLILPFNQKESHILYKSDDPSEDRFSDLQVKTGLSLFDI